MKKLQNHNYNAIDATIIADSKSEFGNRITSFIITFPRIVLAEFNTYRMLSRNSASSRAVPFPKMLEKVQNHPFIPIKWMKNHKGMQGNEFYDEGSEEAKAAEWAWLRGRDKNIQTCKLLSGDLVLENYLEEQVELDVTKQIINRLLEPWMWHTAIVTATEWENFYALRAHPAAEIHIAALAEKILEQANLSTPKLLKPGEWHIPFGDMIDKDKLYLIFKDSWRSNNYTFPANAEIHDKSWNDFINKARIRIATARCARVSYLNFEGKDDYEADIKLHDRLAEMGHWSPFEHCARAMTFGERHSIDLGNHEMEGFSGNFKGFIQYRKMFDTENKKDERLLAK